MKKDIDWSKLDGVLQFNASCRIAAQILETSEDTIERRIKEKYDVTFAEYKDMRMSKTKIMLQQRAIELALKGNTALMIFCLKNLCGWSDKSEIINTENNKFTLAYSLNDNTDRKPD